MNISLDEIVNEMVYRIVGRRVCTNLCTNLTTKLWAERVEIRETSVYDLVYETVGNT